MHLSHPSFSQARLLQEVRWQRWDWRSTCDGTPNAWKGPWVSGFGKTIESIEVGFEVQSNCLCGKPVFFRPPAWVRVFTLQGNYHPAPPKAIKSPTSAWVVQALNIDWTHMTSNGGRTCHQWPLSCHPGPPAYSKSHHQNLWGTAASHNTKSQKH